jgi:hypothetical protein
MIILQYQQVKNNCQSAILYQKEHKQASASLIIYHAHPYTVTVSDCSLYMNQVPGEAFLDNTISVFGCVKTPLC